MTFTFHFAAIVDLTPEIDISYETEKEDLELPLFDFSVIANATSDFSMNSKLGEGGFGPVYKVKISFKALI